ncbi:MAG: C25 family cysteine peptidase, partial [bacterium]
IMINKFLGYERNPYTNASFYAEPLITGGWNSSSWLQINLEAIRGFFEYGLGKNPAHQYRIISGSVYPGCPWSSGPSAQGLVQYFYSLGWLPDTLNPYDSTYWNSGSASGINTVINSGAFFVQHQATGSETGWLHPAYSINDLYGLNNNMFPFVNSTDALTGKFVWGSECFTERFHRISNGALGLNAATEVGYSFVTDVYLWGLIDGMWQEFLPDYPGYGPQVLGYSNLRPSMAMTSAKYFLQQSSWPSNPQQKTATYHLYHHHGDAFTTLYAEMPQYLTVIHDSVVPAGQNTFAVSADDSSVVALTVDGEIIGVAEGTGLPVNVDIQPQAAGATMKVTVTKANYYRYEEDVSVVQVGVSEAEAIKNAPTEFSVKNVTPNPFMDNTVVCYGLPLRAITKVAIYDVGGKLVTILHDAVQQPGWHTIGWNGGDAKNLKSPSGIYFCEIQSEASRIVKKLILLK